MKILAAVTALVLLSSCGVGSDADDVAFMQGMILHHEQAIEMARLAPSAEASPEVVDLARRIKDAQDPEIRQMKAWLRERDESVRPQHGEHEMDMTMGGMATHHELAALATANGTAFDRQFLTLMIDHHEGAIEMSEEVLEEGSDAEVQELARAIIKAQQAEIDEMEGLLE